MSAKVRIFFEIIQLYALYSVPRIYDCINCTKSQTCFHYRYNFSRYSSAEFHAGPSYLDRDRAPTPPYHDDDSYDEQGLCLCLYSKIETERIMCQMLR